MNKHFKCKNCGNTEFTKYDNKSVYFIEVVYQFLYNSDCCESAAATISIHKTQKGAEMAMEFHKNETKKIFENEKIEVFTVFIQEMMAMKKHITEVPKMTLMEIN